MTTADVARLMGRVAFGATSIDLDRWTGREYGDLVDWLLDVGAVPVAVPLPDEPARTRLEQTDTTDEWEPRRWWLERMRTTPVPLLERMTLLWHGHFATAVKWPPAPNELVRQNQTLRTYALGSFRDLVANMTVDPAMIWWLNGFQNAVPNPNENYAREFFELFTLGKRPQVYTERDVREAARAFTGWYVDGTATVFAAGRHDHKSKRVLRQSIGDLGDQEYLRLVDIALAQPVASRFIAFKLVANLCYLPSSTNLLKRPNPLVETVAKALRDNGWSIQAGLRALLMSDDFRYAQPSMSRQLVRTPVETLVHATKALGVGFSDMTLVWWLERMGHSLFAPPNVAGWPLGIDWVSPVVALMRYDAALDIFRLATGRPDLLLNPLPAAADVDGWARALGLAGFGPNTRAAVNAYLRRAAGASEYDRQSGVAALLISSPEFVVM